MSFDEISGLANKLIGAVDYEEYREYEKHNYWEYVTHRLCEALRDLLGPYDECSLTDGPIDLKTNSTYIKAARAVLADVEKWEKEKWEKKYGAGSWKMKGEDNARSEH